ncbi:hypothetical protein GCM10022262_09510 [Georgenia daeguensis]|uniref:VOC domain-containing protein n=2 Tax=Georgenia daeguensis TaxID=908355 RepID=A0ABP8ERH4_9MICO
MADQEVGRAPSTVGLTLQVYVPTEEARAARDYYAGIFGRAPEFEPHEDFFEWAPVAGQECWFQVAGRTGAAPLTNRIRFGVEDLAEAVAFLDVRRIPRSEPTQLSGVVAFVDFTDPWGNRLGYYQDLSPAGEQPEYRGSSVNDESQFEPFRKS